MTQGKFCKLTLERSRALRGDTSSATHAYQLCTPLTLPGHFLNHLSLSAHFSNPNVVNIPFKMGGTEAQRGFMVCLRSHSPLTTKPALTAESVPFPGCHWDDPTMHTLFPSPLCLSPCLLPHSWTGSSHRLLGCPGAFLALWDGSPTPSSAKTRMESSNRISPGNDGKQNRTIKPQSGDTLPERRVLSLR